MKIMEPHECAQESPSMRREWIEILLLIIEPVLLQSPSMRREWIEILYKLLFLHKLG